MNANGVLILFLLGGSLKPALAQSPPLGGFPGVVQTVPGPEIDIRVTSGAYASREVFTNPLDGQKRNDFATVSSRFFLRGSRLGSGAQYEATLDLRDKHDFFDKLDRERLELRGSNTFQARQLSVRRPNEDSAVYFGLGRFPIWEAGAVNVDGGEVGYRFTGNLRSGIFAGLNPERMDQAHLEFNSDAQVYGAYLAYFPKSEGWGRHFHGTAALVGKRADGHLDRTFLSNNLVYQWSPEGQLVSLVYLDFVPRIYVQTAYLSLLQGLQSISDGLSGTLSVSVVDVIQYSRRQNILEKLPPSPYKEATGSLSKKMGKTAELQLRAVHGIRNADSLSRSEVWIGPSFSRFISKHFSAGVSAGWRRDFVSRDVIARANIGYFSNTWEMTLDQEYGLKREDEGGLTHPWLSELGFAYHLSKTLYATTSLQYARDERVNVLSSFFRLGYRFGTKGVAPIRDGSPPRGKL